MTICVLVFVRGIFNRATALGTNKVSRSELHAKILIEDVFGFAENQVKATYGLGFEITMYRKIGSAILSRNAATPDSGATMHAINWFVSLCTPNENQQDFMNV